MDTQVAGRRWFQAEKIARIKVWSRSVYVQGRSGSLGRVRGWEGGTLGAVAVQIKSVGIFFLVDWEAIKGLGQKKHLMI